MKKVLAVILVLFSAVLIVRAGEGGRSKSLNLQRDSVYDVDWNVKFYYVAPFLSLPLDTLDMVMEPFDTVVKKKESHFGGNWWECRYLDASPKEARRYKKEFEKWKLPYGYVWKFGYFIFWRKAFCVAVCREKPLYSLTVRQVRIEKRGEDFLKVSFALPAEGTSPAVAAEQAQLRKYLKDYEYHHELAIEINGNLYISQMTDIDGPDADRVSVYLSPPTIIKNLFTPPYIPLPGLTDD